MKYAKVFLSLFLEEFREGTKYSPLLNQDSALHFGILLPNVSMLNALFKSHCYSYEKSHPVDLIITMRTLF